MRGNIQKQYGQVLTHLFKKIDTYVHAHATHSHTCWHTHTFKTFHPKSLTSVFVTMEMTVIKAQEYSPDNNV